ncbi:MAG: zinc ribbon domain-containing protein [Actinomycetota bacterium]
MDRILELQELDLKVDRLNARRRDLEGGREAREARQRMEEVEGRVGSLRLELDGVTREETRLEAEVASLEAKISAEERRMYDGSVAHPKELEALQAEVASLRNRKSRVEDEVLARMERREEMDGRLPALEGELVAVRERLAEVEASAEREMTEIDASLTSLRAERVALTAELDDELLELYEDLRPQKKGVGAAALRDGVCQGCHQKLSALELDRIKKTEGIRRCEYCRRILVLE